MFPSNSNGNNDPISYIDQSFFQRPFINDINPNSKQEDLPLSFFHLPSPFISYELELEDHDGYLPQQHDLLFHQQPSRADNMTVINMEDSIKNDINKKNHNTNEQIPRKRSCKRDRHSKINTAQGLRDRRMRLSLEVARQFFQLQDMLGYDKASKTVEWLLIQASSEIKKLARGLPQMNYSSSVGAKSASSTSECEVVSGVDEASIKRSISKGKPSIKEKKTKQWRKSTFHPLTKDKREKARAWARERTTRKQMWGKKIDESKIYIDARNRELSQLGSCSPFETGEESGTQSHNMNSSMEVAVAEVEEPSSHGRENLEIQQDMVEVIMGKWSPSTFLNYNLHNIGIPQEHQIADFPFFGKPWEVYNNQNLC